MIRWARRLDIFKSPPESNPPAQPYFRPNNDRLCMRDEPFKGLFIFRQYEGAPIEQDVIDALLELCNARDEVDRTTQSGNSDTDPDVNVYMDARDTGGGENQFLRVGNELPRLSAVKHHKKFNINDCKLLREMFVNIEKAIRSVLHKCCPELCDSLLDAYVLNFHDPNFTDHVLSAHTDRVDLGDVILVVPLIGFARIDMCQPTTTGAATKPKVYASFIVGPGDAYLMSGLARKKAKHRVSFFPGVFRSVLLLRLVSQASIDAWVNADGTAKAYSSTLRLKNCFAARKV